MATKVHVRNLNTTPQLLVLGPTKVYSLALVNNSGQDAWVQLFDALPANVTASITQPDHQQKVLAGQMLNVPLPVDGIFFATAVSLISTTAELGTVGSTAGVHVYAAV